MMHRDVKTDEISGVSKEFHRRKQCQTSLKALPSANIEKQLKVYGMMNINGTS